MTESEETGRKRDVERERERGRRRATPSATAEEHGGGGSVFRVSSFQVRASRLSQRSVTDGFGSTRFRFVPVQFLIGSNPVKVSQLGQDKSTVQLTGSGWSKLVNLVNTRLG
ncbi:hypothetical protein HanIR_Chr13g0615951 [Helianthus annuus]|nr:hypothetical protein HanIR_Chr13g0615951 [Helianthus annuus]